MLQPFQIEEICIGERQPDLNGLAFMLLLQFEHTYLLFKLKYNMELQKRCHLKHNETGSHQ